MQVTQRFAQLLQNNVGKVIVGKEKAVGFINDNPEYFGGKIVTLLVIEGDKGTIITNDPDNITIRNQNYTLGNTVSDGKIILN